MRRVVLVAALTVLTVAPAGAGEGPSYVRATLVADATLARGRDAIRVGALLTLEPGWHVYWASPGEAGLATELSLEVPAGVEVGSLEWPVPMAFTQPGDIPGYGYKGAVMLARPVRWVGGGAPPRSLPVRVLASWLACKDICVLGEAHLEGDLGGQGLAVDPQAFASRTMPLAGTSEHLAVSTTRGESPGELTVWLQWAQPPRQVEWFPAPAAGLGVTVRRVATRGALTRVDLALRRAGVEQPATTLGAVVVASDGAGRRVGYDLSVEVEQLRSGG